MYFSERSESLRASHVDVALPMNSVIMICNSMNQASKSAGCLIHQEMCWGLIFQRVNVCPH